MARSDDNANDAESSEQTSVKQVCPECGNGQMSWIIREVTFGDITRTKGGLQYHAMKSGPVLGSEDESVMCTSCQSEFPPSELVGADEWSDETTDEREA